MIRCELCGKPFKTPQGLSGHLRFRHADPELDVQWTESRDGSWSYLQSLISSRKAPPVVKAKISYLLAKSAEDVGSSRNSLCPECGYQCRTPQGLSGHLRFRHFLAPPGNPRLARLYEVELLVKFLDGHSLPEEVQEALWERISRLLGFPA